MAYFGVYVPPKFEASSAVAAAANDADKKPPPLVFAKKEEAFKVLKTHSDARVKGFANRDDANYFAQYGQDLLNVTSQSSFNDSSKLKSPSSAINPEKVAFRGPNLAELKKAIESGNLTVVHAKLMENPRHLINSGDTPTILKEGYRYNPMHVAVLSKNAKMCDLILSTIKPSYIQFLHGGRLPAEVAEEVASKLLDLYLNMPEKGRFETPLHLAAKYGYADIVEVLVSYPQCKMSYNSDMKLPKDVICFRANSASQEVKDRIAQLLEERFYVPVLRSSDCTVPPVVGEPFSVRNMPNLSAGSGNCSPALTPEMQIRAYAGPMDLEQAESFRKRWRTPPAAFNRSQQGNGSSLNGSSSLLSASNANLSTDNMLLMRSPIRSTNNNKQIQRLLQLSPRSQSPGDAFVSTPKGKSNLRSIDEFIQDKEERELRGSNESLNKLLRVPGLDGFSTSAKKTLLFGSPCKSLRDETEMADSEQDASFRERHIKLTDNEKGLEVVGRLLAKEQNVGWSEYWNFLDNFTNLTTPQGLQQLEQHLKNRAELKAREANGGLEEDGVDEGGGGGKRNSLGKEEKLNISDICDRLNELHLNNSLKLRMRTEDILDAGDQNNNNKKMSADNCDQIVTSSSLNAFLCVEKSCQVYARRAMKIVVNNGESAALLNSSLNLELTRLESLVCSYKDDQRFRKIDFQVVHSRFAHLVLTYLLDDERSYKVLLPKLKRSLAEIIGAKVRTNSGGEEGKDEKEQMKSTTGHLKCLAQFLMTYAENEEEKIQQNVLAKLKSEEDCEKKWTEEAKCECAWIVPKGGGGGGLGNATAGPNVKNPHVMRMRDKNKKKRINDLIKRKIELSQAGEAASKTNHTNGAMWEYRSKLPSAENEEDVIWADTNDSDHSFDSTDSEECFFYTPIGSPTDTEFLTASDRSESEDEEGVQFEVVNGRRRLVRKKKRGGKKLDLRSYKNYILGDEPTKTDVDVFNAICDVEVEEATFPNIAKWQQAIRMHSMDEIQNFPSLSMIVRQSIPICKLDGSPLTGRRLFGSPMKLPMSR